LLTQRLDLQRASRLGRPQGRLSSALITDPNEIPRDRYGRPASIVAKPILWVVVILLAAIAFGLFVRPALFAIHFMEAAIALGALGFVANHLSGIILLPLGRQSCG